MFEQHVDEHRRTGTLPLDREQQVGLPAAPVVADEAAGYVGEGGPPQRAATSWGRCGRNKGYRRNCLCREETTMRSRQSVEHRVCRSHRGQRHVDAVRAPRRHQAIGKHERRLGLPAAGLILDHEERRAGRQLDSPSPRLHRTGGMRADQRVVVQTAADFRRQHTGLFDRTCRSFTCLFDPVRPDLPLRIAVGKPLLAGPDPIRQDGNAGYDE